jgi:hypothetical protein
MTRVAIAMTPEPPYYMAVVRARAFDGLITAMAAVVE